MFEGKSVYLRPLEKSDLPARVKWVNDPAVRRTLMFDYPLSLAKTEWWFSKAAIDPAKRHFSIIHREEDALIGMTGLLDIDLRHQRAQMYITIGEKAFWGRGLADEIIPLVQNYAFCELGLNRLYLYTLPSNARGRKVYERNNFTAEGVLRQHYFCVGELQDLHVHSILRADWARIRSPGA